ncbi:MAG: hypothetical protein ACRD2I_24045, partial [Vicinamibacterales bacterium]
MQRIPEDTTYAVRGTYALRCYWAPLLSLSSRRDYPPSSKMFFAHQDVYGELIEYPGMRRELHRLAMAASPFTRHQAFKCLALSGVELTRFRGHLTI